MIRSFIVAKLQQLAASLEVLSQGTEWHLFGSVDRDEDNAVDIDLMIFCKSDTQADELRQVIDLDSLALPIHLCLMTFDEAAEIDVSRVQSSTPIFP